MQMSIWVANSCPSLSLVSAVEALKVLKVLTATLVGVVVSAFQGGLRDSGAAQIETLEPQ
jgi:hypothetical protein